MNIRSENQPGVPKLRAHSMIKRPSYGINAENEVREFTRGSKSILRRSEEDERIAFGAYSHLAKLLGSKFTSFFSTENHKYKGGLSNAILSTRDGVKKYTDSGSSREFRCVIRSNYGSGSSLNSSSESRTFIDSRAHDTVVEYAPFWSLCILEAIFNSEKARKELPAIAELKIPATGLVARYCPSDGGEPIRMRPIDFVQAVHSKCVESVNLALSSARKFGEDDENKYSLCVWFAYHVISLVSFSWNEKWLSSHCLWLVSQFVQRLSLCRTCIEDAYIGNIKHRDLEYKIPRKAFDETWRTVKQVSLALKFRGCPVIFEPSYIDDVYAPYAIANYLVILLPKHLSLSSNSPQLSKVFNDLVCEISESVCNNIIKCTSKLLDNDLSEEVQNCSSQWFRMTSTNVAKEEELSKLLSKPSLSLGPKEVVQIASFIKYNISLTKTGLIPVSLCPIIHNLRATWNSPNYRKCESSIVCIIGLIIRLNPRRLEIYKCLSRIARFIIDESKNDRITASGLARIIPAFNVSPEEMTAIGLNSVKEINDYLDAWSSTWGWVLTEPRIYSWV